MNRLVPSFASVVRPGGHASAAVCESEGDELCCASPALLRRPPAPCADRRMVMGRSPNSDRAAWPSRGIRVPLGRRSKVTQRAPPGGALRARGWPARGNGRFDSMSIGVSLPTTGCTLHEIWLGEGPHGATGPHGADRGSTLGSGMARRWPARGNGALGPVFTVGRGLRLSRSVPRSGAQRPAQERSAPLRSAATRSGAQSPAQGRSAPLRSAVPCSGAQCPAEEAVSRLRSAVPR
jgi:hypothetical protein